MSDELREKILAGLSDLYSREQVVAKPWLVPEKYGLNLWCFKEAPGNAPMNGCAPKDGMPLLFVGSAPGLASSKRTLRERILEDHCNGKATNSTLRKSLGVLLFGENRKLLRRIGTSDKMTFKQEGEECLSKWMDENAFVCWYEHKTPWKIKKDVITIFSPPLNIRPGTHDFGKKLGERRNEILKWRE